MKVTIKPKQLRCMYDDKIMRVTDYSHCRVRPFPIAHQARSCENYVTTGNGLKMASTAAYDLLR